MDGYSDKKTYRQNETESNGIANYLHWASKHRAFIVLSSLITLLTAIAYLYYTPAEWTRTSQIAMKYDASGRPTTSDILAFDNIGLLSSGISFSNEKHLVNSYVVWDEIVSSLKLNYNYSYVNLLHRHKPLYDDSPIEVQLPPDIDGSSIDRMQFIIRKTESDYFQITGFSINGEDTGTGSIMAKSGIPVTTPAGKITINETPYYGNWKKDKIKFDFTAKNIYIPKMQASVRQSQTDQFSTVIETIYSDFSPKRAEDILNQIPIAYTTVWNYQKLHNADITRKSILVLLDSATKRLNSTGIKITRLLESEKIASPQLATLRHYSELQQYNSENIQLSIAYELTGFVLNKLKQSDGTFETIPLDGNIDDLAIRQQIISYNNLVLEYVPISSGTKGKDNPETQEKEKSLSMMKGNIIQSLTHYRQQLAIKKETNEARYKTHINKIPNLSETERQWNTLQRQYTFDETMTSYLLNKLNECDIAAEIELSPVRIIMPAYGDDKPSFPTPGIVMATALALGLFIIPFAAYAADKLLNYNIKSISELRGFSFSVIGQIPQVGIIPVKERLCNLLHIEAKTDKTPRLLIYHDSLFTESIRQFRNNFDQITANSNTTPVTIVTSFTPSSGKTFVLANLAASTANGGKKTLIIDADIRRASMSRYVGKPRTGLTSYLHGTGTPESVILKDRIIKGLDIIPAGRIPTDPAELLENGRLQLLIDTLRDRYDYIFLDTPPVNIIADTMEMAKVASHTLFVIRRGMLDRRMLPELERIYWKGTYPRMYMVFNGSTPPHFTKKNIRKIFKRQRRSLKSRTCNF